MSSEITSTVKVLDLEVLKYHASAVLSRELEDMGPPAIEFVMRDLPMQLAHRLVAMLKVPGQVLQENRLLAAYPPTLWDYLKRALGWKHRLTEVRLNEHLVYPEVAVPDRHAGRVRLYVAPSIQTFSH